MSREAYKGVIYMTRRIILLTVLLVLMLACASASGESLFVDNRETDKIYPERLNLRDQPSKNGGIIGLYYTGAEVENLGQENEEFTKVHIGGVTGYMASEFLITGEEAAARYGKDSGFGACRAAQVDLTGMWQTVVPLYTEADFRSDSAGEIENGALVSLIGALDDWAYISAEIQGEKKLGYVPLDVLTDVGSLKVSIIAGSKADTRTMLYDAPNDKAKEIMVLKNGTACFSLFGRREGEWRRVRVGGISGWIRYTQTDNLFALEDEDRSVVPYYPLLMQTKGDVQLLSSLDENAQNRITLGKDTQVELLAECGDYGYVRTLEGGVGAIDCGDFGFVRLNELTLAQGTGSVGVAQVDEDDLPAIILDAPEQTAGVIGALCAGAQVRILDYTHTDYIKIALGEMSGYIPKNGVRIITQTNTNLSQRIPQRALTTQDVSLREKPSAKALKTLEVPGNTRVYMLGVIGEWAFIQASERTGLDVQSATDDRTGFVQLSNLNAPASTTHLTARVNTDKVNLRSRPGSDGEIIGKARTDELLRVAEYGLDWSVVVTPAGKRGYIVTSYLEFD